MIEVERGMVDQLLRDRLATRSGHHLGSNRTGRRVGLLNGGVLGACSATVVPVLILGTFKLATPGGMSNFGNASTVGRAGRKAAMNSASNHPGGANSPPAPLTVDIARC